MVDLSFAIVALLFLRHDLLPKMIMIKG